jgi:hypothetical protein
MNWRRKGVEFGKNNTKQKTQNMNHHKNKHNHGSNDQHSGSSPDQKKIELRAYDLYLERGSDPGHDFEDWLQAERELTNRDKVAMSH